MHDVIKKKPWLLTLRRVLIICFVISPFGCGLPNIQATNTPSLQSTQTPSVVPWIDFLNSDWNVTLQYPSTIAGEKLYLVNNYGKYVEGLEYILLLSNIESPTLGDYNPDENLVVYLYRQAGSVLSFEKWAVQLSGFVGPGELNTQQVGVCDAYGISITDPQNNRWARGLYVNS
jgi:hypothetical protein